MDVFAAEYHQRGVVVLPVLSLDELQAYNAHFHYAMTQFPEYLRTPHPVYVLGGFGALGNPASFHHPAIRHLRYRLMSTAIPFFTALAPGMHIEQLFDRTSLRRKGTAPSAELWHRDKSPTTDTVFGGWINLDLSITQNFSCVPGTHNEEVTGSGFKKFTPEEGREFKRRKELVACPPGHWIVFNQHLVHEVLSKKAKQDSLRQYIGFRLTQSIHPLFDNTHVFIEQGVPLLPSGQRPPMFAANHTSFFPDMLDSWSEKTFQSVCLHKTNRDRLRVDRFMESLVAYGFPLYPAYSPDEIAIMTPQLYN